ncbi:MAG: hypothetical protein LBR51_02120, partial [Bacteroidales bacterium]|nr:hypothetical protein [Bacteroidales bacterium]
MKNENILEEEVKNSVAATYFSNFNCTKILGKVDFAVAPLSPSKGGGTTPSPFGEGAGGEVEYLLWAEAKQKPTDLFAMFAQLILTIGKARTFDKIMPPKFLGAFDSEKIAFVPYYEIQELFYLNDFNWNVTPSNTATKEFQLIKTKVEKSVVGRHCGLDPQSPENAGDSCFRRNDEMLTFYFEKDEKELRRFIKENFVVGKGDVTKIEITENNVVHIFHKWVEKVKPTIAIKWKEEAYDYKIYERDFFLADLISENNETFENLTVKLRKDYYKTEVDVKRRLFLEIEFTDGGKAYREFWAKYARPPREIYRNRIRERADLLVLPSFRERAGAFFTPQIWVEKAQEYLADEFGENWQDEYYIWDCAAGTGNLLQGLTKPNRVFASTLDNGDVKIMHDDIEQKRSPLLKDHVFQFDFLNDSFENLPETLLNIIKDEKRRKNLIIYINPPYVEVSSIKGGKKGANQSKIHDKYLKELGTAGREMYTQFFMRICKEIPDSKLAAFSKMKHISGSAFESFRNNFLAEYKKGFICLANFFDNVAGNFPIGFQIWDLSKKIHFKKVKVDIFDNNGQNIGTHHFYAYTNANYINEWISKYNKKPNGEYLGFLAGTNGNGVQHNRIVYIINKKEQMPNPRGIYITVENLIESSVYL